MRYLQSYSKNLDMIIANDVSNGVFGSDVNQVTIIDKQLNLHKTQQLPKLQRAEIILDKLNPSFTICKKNQPNFS